MMKTLIFCVLMVWNAVGYANPLCDIEPCELNARFANGGELRVLGYATLLFGEGATLELGQEGYIDLGIEGVSSFDINARPLTIRPGDALLLTGSGKIRFGAQGSFGLGNKGMIDVAPSGKLILDASSDVRLASAGNVYLSRIWNDGRTKIRAGALTVGASKQSFAAPLGNIEVIGTSLQSEIDIRAEHAVFVGSIDASAVLDLCIDGNTGCTPANPPSPCTPPSSAPSSGGVLTSNGNVSISTGRGASDITLTTDGSNGSVIYSGNGGLISANTGGVIVLDELTLVAAPNAETESASANSAGDTGEDKQSGLGTVTLPVINVLALLYLLRRREQRLRRTAGEHVACKKYRNEEFRIC